MTLITAIITFGTTMKMFIITGGRASIMSTNTETSASFLLNNRKNIGRGVIARVTTTITNKNFSLLSAGEQVGSPAILRLA